LGNVKFNINHSMFSKVSTSILVIM